YRPGKETCKQSGRRPAAGAFLAPLSPKGRGVGGEGRRLHPSPSPLSPLGRGEKKGAQRTAPATLLAGSSSSILVTITSVVSISPAIDAAFCSADRVTLVGSTMPALNMSSYSPVLALYPTLAFFSPRPRTSSATTAPSTPPFSAIWRIGFS